MEHKDTPFAIQCAMLFRKWGVVLYKVYMLKPKLSNRSRPERLIAPKNNKTAAISRMAETIRRKALLNLEEEWLVKDFREAESNVNTHTMTRIIATTFSNII